MSPLEIKKSRLGVGRLTPRLRRAALPAASLLLLALCFAAFTSTASAADQVRTWFGTESGAGSLGGQFSNPRDVAVNRSGAGPANPGDLYVADEANNRIERFDSAGNFVSAWGADVVAEGGSGNLGDEAAKDFELCTVAAQCKAGVEASGNGTVFGDGDLSRPQSLAVDQETGDVYVSDGNNRRINEYTGDGAFVRSFGWDVVESGPDNGAEFQSVTVDASSGSFTLSFGATAPTTTAPIPYNASAQTVEGDLEALGGIGAGNIAVSGPAGGPWTVRFIAARGNVNQPKLGSSAATLAGDNPALPGTGPAIAVAQTVAGHGSTYEICEAAGDVCKAGLGGSGEGQYGAGEISGSFGIAVSAPDGDPAAGAVYLADSGNRRIDSFSLDATTFSAFGSQLQFASGQPTKVAVDQDGILYASNSDGGGEIERYDTSGADGPVGFLAPIAAQPGGPLRPGTTAGLAVGPESGSLYVLRLPNSGPTVVQQIGPVNQPGQTVPPSAADEEHGAQASFTNVLGFGLGENPRRLYVSANFGGGNRVWVLGVTLPPGVTIEPVTTFTGTSATLAGAVTTDKVGAGYHFEYSADGSTWTRAPEADVQLSGDGSEHPVSLPVTGLEAHTNYRVKLVATKQFGGGSAFAQTEFETTTAPPHIASSEVVRSSITDSAATLEGAVNPEREAAAYHFEYLTETAYEANGDSFSGPETPLQAPASPASIGSGAEDAAVSQRLTGLQPATAYRFRLLATNPTGSVASVPGRFVTYPLAQSFSGGCPANEALRSGASTELPDCRAYEQASPVDKNGGGIQGKMPNTKASEAGDAISFESPAGIPGGVGSQEFPTYAALRGADSWSTTGFLPSALAGQSARWLGWTPDFSEVFDAVGIFGGGGGFALIAKSTHTGSEQTIVPYTPSARYAYVGSSADRSTVIFEAGDTTRTSLQLTPDAAPGKLNVYAWSHEAPGTIRLAGILPDGSTPAAGTEAGVAAGEYVRDTHRVAADGSVFFTDIGSGKLYERLNPAAEETTAKDPEGNCEPDPVLACTIEVSPSQKKNGGGSGGSDAAGRAPTSFMDASEDGTTAVFLSSEKLTDGATTGPEPTAPAIARADKTDGSDKRLGFIPAAAEEIAIDEAEGYVYWTDPVAGRIGRANLDGTEVTPGYIIGLHEPWGIAVIDQGSSKYVFWTERGALNSQGIAQVGLGSIGRADLDGTHVDLGCVTGLSDPTGIAADGNYIYWEGHGTVHNDNPDNPEVEGTTVTRAEISCAGSIDNRFIEASTNREGGDVVVDASHVYVSTYENEERPGQIWTSFISVYERDTGERLATFPTITVQNNTNPAKAKDHPSSLAVDGSHLYWTNPKTGEIGRSDLDGSNIDFDFITEAGRPGGLALDGSHLFWTAYQGINQNPGTDLYLFDRTTGKVVDLTVDHGDRNGAEVQGVLGTSRDASIVYFVANGIPDNLGNSSNAEGESAEPGHCEGKGEKVDVEGTCNLYVYHDGSVDFIARLHAGTLFNPGTSNQEANNESSGDALDWVRSRAELGLVESDKTARVSEDGRVLVFRSILSLTGYDNKGPVCGSIGGGSPTLGRCPEFFRFTLGDDHTTCITCDPRGEAPTGPARIASIRPVSLASANPGLAVLGRNLSANGTRFFFETPDALVGRDTNGEDGCPQWGGGAQRFSALSCQDVYEWEAPSTGSCRESSTAFSPRSGGCIYLISTGNSDQATFFADASKSGNDVFLYTSQQLVPQDKDNLVDVYDARAGGGLAAQQQAAAVPCEGEACKGQPAVPPAVPSPGSSNFSGPGNQSPEGHHKKKRQHKKRHAKKNGQRKKKHQKRSNRRAAKTTGRAGR